MRNIKPFPRLSIAVSYHCFSFCFNVQTSVFGFKSLSLDITAEKAEIIGFSLFNDKGEKVDIYFNLPERKLVMDRTKSGIVDFGKNSVNL